MSLLVVYLGATVLFAQSTVAFNCSIKPIYVDIHKRAVHESSHFQYGSFIGVGTPAQNHSLWPSISQNHTSFARLGYCQNSTRKDCQSSTGGFFQNEDSSTFTLSADFKSLDVGRGDNSTFTGFFGQDHIRLYTHYYETDGAWQTLVPNSTVELAEEGSIAPGIVGIGLQSTLLQTLASQNLIAGRTYSLYIGQGFDRAGGAVNGSNTFGGYDAGRFKGPAHAYKMKETAANPFTVRVKDILITGPDAQNVSLFSESAFPDMQDAPQPFEAEITTDQFPLSLPYDITQNFITHLDAEEDNTWGDNSLRLRSPFNGTLSIILDDGFVVTLPAEVLSNASNITPIQSRPKDSDSPFLLSTAFLSQVYLMADFDSFTYYLAEAKQKDNAVMPRTFCPKSVPEAYQSPKQSAWVKQGLIGAVVGGVVGGIGIALMAFFFLKAWMRRREERRGMEVLEEGKPPKMAKFQVVEVPEFDPPPSKKGGVSVGMGRLGALGKQVWGKK